MASRYGTLVKEAIMLLDKFNTSKLCLDEFNEDALKNMESMSDLDKTFVLDVISGCVEQKKLLDVVVKIFYGQNGKFLSRGDRTQFVIVCYLAVFLLDDIGFQRFSNIVKSLDVMKMHKFLSFFFSVTHLTTWIPAEWSKIYDAAYVERNLIGPLLRWRPKIEVLIDKLAARLSCRSQAKWTTKVTEPQEFSLSKPKPRPLPVPESIPQAGKPHPVPDTTYRTPQEVKAMEEIKRRNRHKSEQLLSEANMTRFQCANPQKSEHTMNTMAQIRESLDSKLKFNSFQSSRVPTTHKTKNWPIKLNNTAILREGALYNRLVEEEIRRMEHLMEGAREPSSFQRWQKEMRERDLQEELAQVEQRRLEGRISFEEAAIARTRIMEHNQQVAQLKKEETAQLMRRYAENRLQEEKGMRDLVKQVSEGHKNSAAARVRLQELKQQIVKDVSEQNQELLRQALEDAQAELIRKFEVIREIHAIESVPPIRHKFVDMTETAGHDLFGEMSLVELKERLAILKEAQWHEREERRQRIAEEKQCKEYLLLEQLDMIDLHRKAREQAAVRRKEEKKTWLGVQQAVSEDERVLALQKKLEEKRQERQRVRKIEKDKKILKELHWADSELSVWPQVQTDTPDIISQRKTLKT